MGKTKIICNLYVLLCVVDGLHIFIWLVLLSTVLCFLWLSFHMWLRQHYHLLLRCQLIYWMLD